MSILQSYMGIAMMCAWLDVQSCMITAYAASAAT